MSTNRSKKLRKRKQLHRTNHDHINNLLTYLITGPMVYYQNREPVYIYVHCTPHAVQKKKRAAA